MRGGRPVPGHSRIQHLRQPQFHASGSTSRSSRSSSRRRRCRHARPLRAQRGPRTRLRAAPIRTSPAAPLQATVTQRARRCGAARCGLPENTPTRAIAGSRTAPLTAACAPRMRRSPRSACRVHKLGIINSEGEWWSDGPMGRRLVTLIARTRGSCAEAALWRSRARHIRPTASAARTRPRGPRPMLSAAARR